MTGSWVLDFFIYGSVVVLVVPIIALIRKVVIDKKIGGEK